MFDRDPATATIGKEILRLETTQFSEFFQKKAEKELRETAERRIQCLKQIKDMITNDPSMRNKIVNDDFLLPFLRVRKYNVAEAFSRLKSFTELMKTHPEFVTNYRFETLSIAMKNKIINLLPWRCQDGCAILLVEIDNWKPEEFSTDEVKRMYLFIFLQSLRYPMTQVNGFKVIFHSSTTSLKQLRHCTPQNLYLMVHGALNCLPCRYKGIHVISESLVIKTCWMIMKPFLSEKMKKRVLFHPSQETLLNYFPREVLPIKYGGTLENYDMLHWLSKMMQPKELEIMFGGKYQPDYRVAVS